MLSLAEKHEEGIGILSIIPDTTNWPLFIGNLSKSSKTYLLLLYSYSEKNGTIMFPFLVIMLLCGINDFKTMEEILKSEEEIGKIKKPTV